MTYSCLFHTYRVGLFVPHPEALVLPMFGYLSHPHSDIGRSCGRRCRCQRNGRGRHKGSNRLRARFVISFRHLAPGSILSSLPTNLVVHLCPSGFWVVPAVFFFLLVNTCYFYCNEIIREKKEEEKKKKKQEAKDERSRALAFSKTWTDS